MNNTRKGRQTSSQFEAAKNNIPSAVFLNRLDELEKRVAALEQELSERQFRLPEPPKGKPGPKPKLRKEDVLQRRDALILWFENNWPELRLAIRKAEKAEHLIPALRKMEGLSNSRSEPPFYTEWQKYWPVLWEFLQSGRYYNNPRNLANAMAAIPEMSWKRSFDICSSNPSHLEIQHRAVLDYLQRKVPERLKAIRGADEDPQLIREILRRRTKDRQLLILADQADYVLQYLEEGKVRR